MFIKIGVNYGDGVTFNHEFSTVSQAIEFLKFDIQEDPDA